MPTPQRKNFHLAGEKEENRNFLLTETAKTHVKAEPAQSADQDSGMAPRLQDAVNEDRWL